MTAAQWVIPSRTLISTQDFDEAQRQMEEHLAPFFGGELRFDPLIVGVVTEALDDGEAGNLGGAPDREGCRVVGRSGDPQHREHAALAVLVGKNQTNGADGVAGSVVGQDRMNGVTVEIVVLKSIGAVGWIFEPVVDTVDLETDPETLIPLFRRCCN
jgi:hypothetical protein